ncbi:hypothetical protein PV326_011857, partial [Microctonus aethiopoides]
ILRSRPGGPPNFLLHAPSAPPASPSIAAAPFPAFTSFADMAFTHFFMNQSDDSQSMRGISSDPSTNTYQSVGTQTDFQNMNEALFSVGRIEKIYDNLSNGIESRRSGDIASPTTKNERRNNVAREILEWGEMLAAIKRAKRVEKLYEYFNNTNERRRSDNTASDVTENAVFNTFQQFDYVACQCITRDDNVCDIIVVIENVMFVIECKNFYKSHDQIIVKGYFTLAETASLEYIFGDSMPTVKDIIQEDESQIYVKYFKSHKCNKLISADVEFPILIDIDSVANETFISVFNNGSRAVVLKESTKQQFVGMLTFTDFIKVILFLFTNSNLMMKHYFREYKFGSCRK